MIEVEKVKIVNDNIENKKGKINNLKIMEGAIVTLSLPISYVGSLVGNGILCTNNLISVMVSSLGLACVLVPSSLLISSKMLEEETNIEKEITSDLNRLHEYALEDNKIYSKKKTWRTFYK